ncbi:MAG: helix-turn-helix transcriptional regulator, partial [Pseudomonadota bacterium]
EKIMANKTSYLGEFEHVVMLSILSLGDNAYGVTIRENLKQAIGRDVAIGALYSTAERLERKGLLASSKRDATAERGGKAKRYFCVTAPGMTALEETKRHLNTLWQQLPANKLSVIGG